MSAGVRPPRPFSKSLALACVLALLNACSSTGVKPEAPANAAPEVAGSATPPPSMMQQIVPGPIVLKESYLAKREPDSKIVGLTVVQNPNGAPWVYAADAHTDNIVIFDAPTGRFMQRFGERGSKAGQFDGLTGIAFTDTTLFVAERNNRRIQMFFIPDLKPMSTFGENALKSPRGVFARSLGQSRLQVYVPDVEGEQLVVKIFNVSYQLETGVSSLDRPYGYDTSPTKVNEELIATIPLDVPAETPVAMELDAANERVMIAAGGKLKQIGFSGEKRGEDIKLPDMQGTVSGLGLFACPNDADRGYWIVGDRGSEHQDFRVYDRKTFAPLTFYRGEQIRDSAAMAFTTQSMAFFNFGATFAVHSGNAMGSLSWEFLARQTGLRRICL